VYSVGTNDLVVETGAADVSGSDTGDQSPDAYIDLTYYIFRSKQIKIWQEDLQFILNDLRANKNGNGDPNATEGSNSAYNNVNGEWNPTSPSLANIMNNVCQQPTCN